MLFAELPQWARQVLRSLSREGYIYIGRTGVGLSHNFRKECMNQGTVRAIEKCAEYHDLAYRLLLEEIAILGPKYVAYEKIKELMQQSPILRALKAELT